MDDVGMTCMYLFYDSDTSASSYGDVAKDNHHTIIDFCTRIGLA